MDNSQVSQKIFKLLAIMIKNKLIENILYLDTHIKISKMMHDMR